MPKAVQFTPPGLFGYLMLIGTCRASRCLDYFRRPFTTPEVEMTKYRAYPFLITAISLLAATGGAWRIG